MEKLPHTQDALLQRIKHVVYQSGVWTSSIKSQLARPSLHDFGWIKGPESSSWSLVWIIIPEVSKACRERIKYGCKGACTTYKCFKEISHVHPCASVNAISASQIDLN